MILKEELIKILDEHGFEYFIKEHSALFTVEDSKLLRGQIDGAHSKNLFLKDAKGNFFLILDKEVRKINHSISTKSLFFIKPYSLFILFNSL